jgi:pSer/pThr/pTyr-binding forkhead associated (FHA) protein
VEDLQSTNGTWVNDERIGRLQLAAGDRLRVGRVELKVERG